MNVFAADAAFPGLLTQVFAQYREFVITQGSFTFVTLGKNLTDTYCCLSSQKYVISAGFLIPDDS